MQNITVAATKQVRDPILGTMHRITLSNGKEVTIQRCDSVGTMGLPGWHLSFQDSKAHTYLGDTKAEALAELVARESRAAKPVETVTVTPLELQVGDRVMEHGAVFQVEHIKNYEDGGPVASCLSRLIGDNCGTIPRSWLDTRESMRSRGNTNAMELPDGVYWTIQGNSRARVRKVIA